MRSWIRLCFFAGFTVRRSLSLIGFGGMKLNESGEYDVVLEDGTRLRLSRRYRKQFAVSFERWWRETASDCGSDRGLLIPCEAAS